MSASQNSAALAAHLGETLARYPEIAPYLRIMALHTARTGALRGRKKLGERLPPEALKGLYALLPNRALDIKPDNTVYVRLDRIMGEDQSSHPATSPAGADSAADDQGREQTQWIEAICAVTGVKFPQETPATRKRQAMGDAHLLLRRCELAFPGFGPIWNLEAKQEKQAGPMAWRGLPDITAAVMARSLKEVQEEYFQLAEATCFLLSSHAPVGLADLSARFFTDSKTLKTTPSLVKKLTCWLMIMGEADGKYGFEEAGDVGPDDRLSDNARSLLWAKFGLVENATAIKVTVYGPLVYAHQRGIQADWIFQLHRLGETATLSLDNLQNMAAITLPENTPVITCENETPFYTMVRAQTPGLIVYTAGYPNTAVIRLLQLLAETRSERHPILHWGDSDLDGLRIAAIINQIHPVQLWRCNLPELERHSSALLPISPDRLQRAQTYQENHPDFPFRDELTFTIENGWLEQEKWSKQQ